MSLKLILNKLTSMVLVICMLLSLAAPAVGEEPLTQPAEETVEPVGTTAYPDGTVVYADGTIVYADGTTMTPDGLTVTEDGSKLYPDGTLLYPDGMMKYANGTTVYPDGTTVYADGTAVYANGTIVYADGTTVHADGTTVNADGTTVYPDGTTVYTDGTLVYADGTTAYPDGTVVYPDGRTLNPDGRTVYPDGTTVYADGTTVNPDGTTIYPDGTTVYADGTTVNPDGTTIYPDGTTVYTDGTTVNPDGTTIYPDGTTVYPDGTTVPPDGTTDAIPEEPVPLAEPVPPVPDPMTETPEQPAVPGEIPADPAASTEPTTPAETQPATDPTTTPDPTQPATDPTPAPAAEETTEPATEGGEAGKIEDQDGTETVEPKEETEGQTGENPEGTPAPEETVAPEETAAPAEELPLRTLTVAADQMAFRDQFQNPREPVLWSGSVWNCLYGTTLEPAYTDGHVTVEISGRIPETVTARAMFVEFSDPGAAQNNERALLLLDVALLDETGAFYVPAEALHVSVSAVSISAAVESGEPFAAYFDDAYDGVGDAGDVRVGLDDNIDGSRLAYIPGLEEELLFWEAGDRLVSTENGTVDFDSSRFPFRFVLSAQQEPREEAQPEAQNPEEEKPAVEDVMLSGTLVASDGYTYEISVSYPANCGIPVGAELSVEELLLGTDAYWDYINQSAAELGVSPAELSLARAFDISLVDPQTGEHYQPTQDVQVSITLISTPVNTEEEVAVLHFDDEAGQVQAMDVALNGESIEFETSGFSVFTVLQKDRKTNLMAASKNVATPPAPIENLTYNGSAQTLITAGETASGTMLYSLDGIEYRGEIPSAADAGSYTVYYKASDDEGSPDLSEQYVTAVINRAEVSVTANDISKSWGESDPELTANIEGLIGEDTVEYTLSRAEGETVGRYGIAASGAAVQGNYTVSYVDGIFTITQRSVTITAASESKVYDGYELSYDSYTSNGLAEGDRIESVTVTGSQTGVGACDNVPSAAKIVNANGEDVTDSYMINYVPGVLTITSRPITIWAEDDHKYYDRTPLTNSGYLLTGSLANGDRLESVTITGTQTEVGTSDNVPSAAKIVNAADEDVTANYEITYEPGTLEIRPKNVFVTANNCTKRYGESDAPLTAWINGLLQGDTENIISYTLSRVEGEDAGSYTITPSGEARQSYYNVIYRTGTLTITPASVTVKADDKEKVAGGQEPEYTATVTGLQNGDNVSVITYTLSRPDKGTSDGEKSGAHTIVAAGEENQGNYTVEFENGVLTIKKLTVTFKNGDDTVRTRELELNQPIGEVDNLAGVEKPNCDFEGWYTEGGTEKITSETTFSASTDLYAHFTVTVSFEADGITPPSPVTLAEGAEIGTLPEVSREGYRFVGWYRTSDFAGDPVADTDTFSVHTTLYAKFVKRVTVRFEVATVEADGTTTSPIADAEKILDQGTSLSTADYPSVTVPEGYAFKGWFVGSTPIDENYEFTVDTTVTARVVKQTTVTFMAEQDDGTVGEFDTDTGDVNRSVSFPDPAPSLTGATFKGWYDGDTQVSNGFTAAFDRTLTAHYTVTVNFVVKDADYTDVISETPVVIDKGATLGDKLLNDPVMTGYAFKGWYIADSDGKPGETQVKANSPEFSKHTTVVAKFTEQATLIFDTDGTRHEYTVDVGETVQLLENPVKDNARFDGWFDENGKRVSNAEGITDENGNLVDLEGNPLPEGAAPVRTLKVTKDKTLTAHFIEQITVRFLIVHPVNMSSEGTPSLDTYSFVTFDKPEDGLLKPFPADPELSGYQFQGWYGIEKYSGADKYSDIPVNNRKGIFVLDKNKDGIPYVLNENDPVDARTQFVESRDVVAKFAKKVNLIFQYDSQNEPVECVVGEKLTEYAPSEAQKDKYRLEWYKDGSKLDANYLVAEEDDNKVISARYIKQVTLTFQVEGQEVAAIVLDEGTSVSSSGEAWPVDPANQGSAHFIGWFDEEKNKYDENTVVTSDVTLSAVFGYTVTFKAHMDGTEDELVDTREVEANTALGWLPDAPFWVGHHFKEWRNDENTVIDASNTQTYTIDHDQIITAYFDEIDIYTVVVNYMVGTEITDTKIITVDKSAVTAENPTTIASPDSFKKSNAIYYPVMQEIQLVPGEDTLVIKDKHTDVTIIESTDTDGNKTITIAIPYLEADATYMVHYMLLNLDGDENKYTTDYTMIPGESEEFDGVVGATITPTVKAFTYAELKKADPGRITAASGNVFYVYYTRKNFTLTYDTTGGNVLQSVISPYGTTITLPTNPERRGYSFAGWYKDENLTQAAGRSLTLEQDTTVFAKWTPQNTNYTIVYLFEKYNDAGTTATYVYDNSRSASGRVGTTVQASSAPTITRTGWEKDTTRNSTSSVTIAADGSSVLYVYYKLIEYTFRFNAGTYTYNYSNYNAEATLTGKNVTGTGILNYTMTVKLGQSIANAWPSNVTGRYYRSNRWRDISFNGWLNPQENTRYVTKRTTVTPEMLPTSGTSITYTAQWTATANTYTVNYWLQNADDDGYTLSEEYSQTYTSSGGNLGAKEIAGYTYDHGNSGAQGVTTYNFYYNRNTFKIDYYYGSSLLDTIANVKFDANINKAPYKWIPSPTQCSLDNEYTFVGWYADSGLTSEYSFDTMPASNLVLYAKWQPPKYTVFFHLNYEGASPEPYFIVQNVEKNEQKTLEDYLSEEDKSRIRNPVSPENFTFTGWFTSEDGNDQIEPSGITVKSDLDIYAHWKPTEITRYRVYYQDGNGINLLDPVTRYGKWQLNEEVTETAPYIAGYQEDNDTLVADAGTKTLKLGYDDEANIITFIYDKKPDTISYTVRYVLFEDNSINVAEPKQGTVSGSYTSVTETAVEPREEYKDYRPTEISKTLALGTDSSQNILTFYYTRGAKITVSYMDMLGDQIPGKVNIETYQDVGAAFQLDTALSGYTLAYVEKNGERTEENSFTPTSNTETIDIKVYYQYKLSILARSLYGPYDSENPLTDAGVYDAEEAADHVTVTGLKDGHTLNGITITGSRTEVGVGASKPSAAVIGGLSGIPAEDQKDDAGNVITPGFYDITYTDGILSVTKINVIISLEPDRRTETIYDGTAKPTGFTNKDKSIEDYIIISNEQFKNDYLYQIWTGLKGKLAAEQSNYRLVDNALKQYKDLEDTTQGLNVFTGIKDAGDYYVPAATFETALMSVLRELNVGGNYNIIHYVRESRLEIVRAPLLIKTEGAEKAYDGTPLTKPEMTVTVNGTAITPEGQNYTLAEGDTVAIKITGSQTHPGTSQNIYEITWGDVKEENYTLSEDLGKLEVKARPILIEAQDLYKAFGEADPDFTVKVYPGKYVQEVDDEGNPLEDENGNPVYKPLVDTNGDPILDANGEPVLETERDGDEIPATLSRWAGDNYTLQLNDTERGYTENLSIKITRDAGKIPGTYVITPAWADDAVQNYNVTYVNGRLAICIARVSNDNGETWTYHQWLENDTYNDPIEQGAFDKARALGGNVIVETLSRNDAFAEYNIADRYVLGKQVVLDDTSLTSLIFRTTEDADFTSVVSRGYDGGSLFTNKCAFTLENITLDGDKDHHTSDTDGGLVYVQAGGALTVNPGATLRNSAASGRGNAVFVSDGGSLTMTGGFITGNNNTTGSAVEIGGAGASLTFSGDAVIYDNLTDEAQHNVCLNYDSVGVINAAGLSSDAKIGVYVEDTAASSGAVDGKLFADRGGVLDHFGTYTDSSNLQAFVNDRNGLKGAARSTDEIIWVQPITVEVRYLASLKDYETLPTPALNSYMMDPGKYLVVADIEYVPTLGSSTLDYDALQTTGFTIEQIEQDIYNNFGGSTWTSPATDTMIFWRGYAGNEEVFSAYLESLQALDDGKWSFDKNNDSAAPETPDAPVPVGSEKLVLYYTEPAYITVSNDSGYALTNNNMLVMLPGWTAGDTASYGAPDSGDSAVISALDYAYITKIGDTEQPKPYNKATAADLSLTDGSSVTLMIPGAVGAMYWFDGEFQNVVPLITLISVERYGGTPASNEKIIQLDTLGARNYSSSATPALPMSQGDASNHHLYGGLTKETVLHFEEAYICKITDADGNLLRVDGKIQAFKTLEEGFKAYTDNALEAYTTRDGASATPAYIKMLVEDYALRLGSLGGDYAAWSQITAPAGKLVILATAETTDEELPGPYDGSAETRCIINRGSCATSMFSVPASGDFGTENIILDGGAVFDDAGYISGEINDDGGIVRVAGNGALTISQGTLVRNTAVTSTDAANKKGGAIYAAANSTLSIIGDPSNPVVFTNCQANGGGAIYNPGTGGFNGTVRMEYCTFSHCYAKGTKDDGSAGQCGGGAVRCMANTFTMDHCDFTNCSAVQQGGAIYHLKNGGNGTEFKAEYCTFSSCRVYDPAGKVQAASGGMESQAKTVTVEHCQFENCSATKNAGALNVYNTGATINVRNSTFTGCKATGSGTGDYGNGGALRTTGSSTTVESCTFVNCEANNRGGAIHCKTNTTITGTTSITNCKATLYGGGAVYLENGTLTIEAETTIKNCEAPDGGAIYQGGGTCNFNAGTITDCVAKTSTNNNRRGGGVYMGGGTFNMKGGTITRCYSLASGGGVYMGGGTLNMTNGTITRCNSYSNGGGVCLNAANATFNLQGGAITRCNSLTSGGGVYMGGGTFKLSDGEINNCSAKTGGGVYINGSSTVTVNKTGTAIRDCKAVNVSVDETTGVFTIADSYAVGNNGGGLYQNGGTLTIENAAINGCSAYDGGGIFLDGGSFTLKSGTIGGLDNNDKPVGGNEAKHGGGLFVANGTDSKPTEAHIEGGLLGGNHATEVAGGGGIAIGGPNVRLYFQGSIQVWGNTMEPTPDYPDQTTCDVCLSEDSNEIIRTTSKGLNEDSHIGVYVPDILIGDESLFEDLHGTTGLPFGTFEKSGNGDSCLNRFINNRSEGYEAYYGVRKSDSEDAASEYGRYRIYWVDFVCEITDPDGNLLFMSEDATAPALFQYLDKFGAFEALRNHTTFYDKEGNAYSGTDYDVRMLVLEYDLKWNVPVEVPNKGKVTLTMADKSDASLPTSVRKRYDSCGGITTIGRGVSSGSMFTTAQNSNFILKNVTLDGGAEFSGGAWSKGVNVDGALINANGNVTLDDKVLLCNSYSTKNGGAIAYSGPGTLTMNSGSVIDHCKAQNGAVLYVNTAGATDEVNILMNGALWQNCEASNGLIGVNAGVVNLNGEFDNRKNNRDTEYNAKDCSSTNGGLAYVSGGTLNVTGTVKDFTAVLGGAIFETGANAKVNISAGEISGNTATGFGGGALRIEGGAQAEISGDALISNNKVEGSGDKYGGAINVKKGTLTISGGTITGNSVISTNSDPCYGGAIHADGSSEVIITGGTITGNQAGSGSRRSLAYGGAISLRNGAAAAISGDKITITGNTVVGTKGYGAGIYLEEGTTLSLSGAPDFGGTDTNADGTILGTYGNFITLVGYSSKTNGQKSYPASNQVRQDIYIAEKHENDPQSIVLTGALTGADGTIWVWAEKEEHYRQLMPFARLAEGVTDGGNLNAFRNARDDTMTENATDTWLYGTLGEEGETGYGSYVYWTGIAGSRKVILRKVNDQYDALSGKSFTIYKGNATSAYQPKGEDPLENLKSGPSGCFWIGNLPYGWYIVEEGASGPYFYIVVVKSGTYGTLDDDGKDIVGGFDKKATAQSAAESKYNELK